MPRAYPPATFDIGPGYGADGLTNGEAAFAEEADDLMSQLGTEILEVTIYQVDVHGLRSDEVHDLSRELAGPLSLYRHVGANRFLLLATSTGPESGAALEPLRRLGLNVRQLLAEYPRSRVHLDVREVKRWSAEIDQVRYLLYELASSAPHRIDF